ncbi:MAG: hypothetical protein J6K52_03480 [Clostridia bacterium]|nr:hypothetical protein [Clostridia bacterium]
MNRYTRLHSLSFDMTECVCQPPSDEVLPCGYALCRGGFCEAKDTGRDTPNEIVSHYTVISYIFHFILKQATLFKNCVFPQNFHLYNI